MSSPESLLQRLTCRACCTEVEADRPVGVCRTCGQALLATYDLARLDGRAWMSDLASRPPTLWRFRELLPVASPASIVTLGEPTTPVLDLPAVPGAESISVAMKDDGGLPTGSFKARGMTVAVSRARELGLTHVYVPSAGNAGVALAAYGSRAGLTVRVYLPAMTPPSIAAAVREYGADLRLLPGTLREVGAEARRVEGSGGGFDLSTMREPYRVEGKKTMGFEIYERMGPEGMPDAIVYPTGGGTGLVGMFKAFSELRTLGLLDRSPRLLAVQGERCAPIVRALRDGAPSATPWEGPSTVAPGLLVAAPFASERVLEAIRESGGAGVTVSDAAILLARRELAHRYGISAAPEGAATYAAIPALVRDGLVRPRERVLLYNTGSGLPFVGLDLAGSTAPPPR